MIIELSPQEMITAGTIGVRRQVAALFQNRRPSHGAHDNSDSRAFDDHIIGAMAEYAVAKTLNLFWDPSIGKVKKGDVGGFVEVRVRRVGGTGLDLVIRPGDEDDAPYVLVHAEVPRFFIKGWLYGRDGKAGGFVWNEQRRLWFIPPEKINAIEELKTHA